MPTNCPKGMGDDPTFTVFTPTYNRAHTLHRVYESLLAQTFQNFEWLVVDDGSTDDTAEIVEQWQQSDETWFPIRYTWQENQHKKVAHNRALGLARGRYMLVFDSDDRCVPETLERFDRLWRDIPADRQDDYFCVCGLCKYEDGRIVGDEFPIKGDYLDSDTLELRFRYKVRGEKWAAMRTSVLREYPFPEEIPGLVAESVVWDRIARRYKTRCVNEALRIYCQDQDGLMARHRQRFDPAENALGDVYRKRQVLSEEIDYFRCRPLWFLLEAARLMRSYGCLGSEDRGRVRFWPTSVIGKVLVVLALPLSLMMWLRDRAGP